MSKRRTLDRTGADRHITGYKRVCRTYLVRLPTTGLLARLAELAAECRAPIDGITFVWLVIRPQEGEGKGTLGTPGARRREWVAWFSITGLDDRHSKAQWERNQSDGIMVFACDRE